MSRQADGADQPSPVQRARHIDALTGARIVAAAAVFLSHTPVPEFAPHDVGVLMTAGYNGVTFFFVLSGFVLAWTYAERMSQPSVRGLWSFGVARVARIYPVYLLVLFWVVSPLLVQGTPTPGLWQHVLGIQAWDSDFSRAIAYNGPAWSLSVEFFLYACFPLLILALAPIRANRRALVTVAAVALVIVFGLAWWFSAARADVETLGPDGAHRWLYRMPLTRLGDFVVGMCAALLVRCVTARRLAGTAAQVVGVVSFVGLSTSDSLLWSAWSFDAAYLVPSVLVIWGLATNPWTWLARFLASKPMVLFGGASFAFYLLHTQFMDRLAVDVGATTVPQWAFSVAMTFSAVLLLSVGVHLVVEGPAQQWIRGTFDRTRRAPAVDVAVPVTEPLDRDREADPEGDPEPAPRP